MSGSPATTALSDEETDEEDVQEVEEDCLSSRRDDVENLQATSSPPLSLSNIPDGPSKRPSPVKIYRTSLADISNVPGIPDTAICNEVTELRQQVDMLQKQLAEVERAAVSTIPPINSMSWAAAAMSPSYGSAMSNPFGFYVPSAFPPYSPPFMTTPSTFETPRSSMIREADLDDDIDFDVFANYGSKSPLRIKRDAIEDCWRKRCSHSNFGVLLTKKCFSEKERATSNCTGDHRYGKRLCHPIALRLCEKQLLLYSPHIPDQKKQTGGRPTKMPLTLVAEA